jgi:hypothetical protein
MSELYFFRKDGKIRELNKAEKTKEADYIEFLAKERAAQIKELRRIRTSRIKKKTKRDVFGRWIKY